MRPPAAAPNNRAEEGPFAGDSDLLRGAGRRLDTVLAAIRVFPLTTGILAQLPAKPTIAVLRLRSLGDTVLTTPALALLRQARPDARIVVVVEQPFDALLAGNPDVARTLSLPTAAGLRAKLGLLGELRRERPALCLNLHGGSTSAWLCALCGARWRAGFAHFRHRFVYNILIPRAQETLGRGSHDCVHTAEHLASAVFHLGAPAADIPRARLHAHPTPRRGPYAILHVTAAYATKQWAAENFLAIARWLASRGLEPVILAGPGEEESLRLFGEIASVAGRPLAEVVSAIAGAELFVGNDSGPAHIAAAFSVPCVVVFGSSDSRVWRPWKTPHSVVETPWDCKPCPGDRCYAFDEPRCILSVEEQPVRAAIERLLNEKLHNHEDGSGTDSEGRAGISHPR